MTTYRRKPEVVEAVQSDIMAWSDEKRRKYRGLDFSWGDWIVYHADGTRSVLSPEEFEKQYEEVADGTS